MRFNTPVSQITTAAAETANRATAASMSQALACNRRGLIWKLQSLLDRYVPGRPFTDFFRWACSDRNPQQDAWFQLSGIDESARLTVDLLSGMAEKERVDQMMLYGLPIAGYQVVEELTDRLAGSLAAAAKAASVRCLAAEKCRAADLLKDVEGLASVTSLFGASRDPGRFRTVAEQYVRETGRVSIEALDGDLWSLLVLTVESCRDAALSMRNRRLGPIVKQVLMDTFRRQGGALDGSVPVSRGLMEGSDSSRWLPVLAFYIAVIEPVLGAETLHAIEADAAFVEALSVAAMLVRLLKDVGTPLLTNAWVRTQFVRLLEEETVVREGETLASILLDASGELGDWLAGTTPDLARGESNVCLSGLLNLHPAVAIPRFRDRVDYLAGTFSNGRKYLDRLAQDITAQAWNEGPSKLVLRFVEFHERMDAGAAASSITQVHRAVS